jgi:hypothetical protein
MTSPFITERARTVTNSAVSFYVMMKKRKEIIVMEKKRIWMQIIFVLMILQCHCFKQKNILMCL